jgi:hypothetical protein
VCRESIESLGQLIRHGQVGRMIRVELNDVGAVPRWGMSFEAYRQGFTTSPVRKFVRKFALTPTSDRGRLLLAAGLLSSAHTRPSQEGLDHMASDDFPLLISSPEHIIPMLNTTTTLVIGGIWGVATSGQTWMATDGQRFIWSADGLQVIYSRDGKFFTQSSRGFVNDVRTYPAVAAAISAKPWVRIAQTEVKLLMGIIAGASGVGFYLVVGTEIAEFVIENRDNFAKWSHQLDVVLQARQILKGNAPVLYDKVFNAVLKKMFWKVLGNIPDSVTPEVVFFGLGVIIGHVGEAAEKGEVTWTAIIWLVVAQLAKRLLLGVVPEAIKLTEDEYRKMADQIIGQLRNAGVAIQEGDIRKIVEEVRQHPDTVKQAFDLMRDAFENISALSATGG